MDRYDTILSPNEEADFQKWKAKNAQNDSGFDYDLRGAYKEGFTPDPETNHWADKFKKPWHPTFSNESKYYGDAPENAGRWLGEKKETYIPPGESMPQFRFPPPTIQGKSAAALGLSLAPQSESTIQVPVSGDMPITWPDVYTPQRIAPPVQYQEPAVNQDFSQLQGYQNELLKSPALHQQDYNPSILRRILAGAGGGAAGYQGGALAGLQTGEAILDTPYRRAMERYHQAVEPYSAGAKAELEKYGKDIDYLGKSTSARKMQEDINRAREESSRQEQELRLKSVGEQTKVANARTYENSVTAGGTQLIPGFNPEQPDIYQTNAVNKINRTVSPTGIRQMNPEEQKRLDRESRERNARIMAENFNVSSQQVRIAEMGATARVHAKHPEFDRFFSKTTGMPEWPGGEQSGAEWLAYKDALSQHQAETRDILGTVKSKAGIKKRYIGGYEIVNEEP